MLMVSTASQTLHHYRGSPQTGSPNKWASVFGTLCLRPNPSLPLRTSDTRKTLSEMAVAFKNITGGINYVVRKT